MKHLSLILILLLGMVGCGQPRPEPMQPHNESAELIILGGKSRDISIEIPNPEEWKSFFRDIRKAPPFELLPLAVISFKNNKNATKIWLLPVPLYSHHERKEFNTYFLGHPRLEEEVFSLLVPLINRMESDDIRCFTLGRFIVRYFNDTEKIEKGVELLEAFAKDSCYPERRKASYIIEYYNEKKEARDRRKLGNLMVYPFNTACKKPKNIVLRAELPKAPQKMMIYMEDYSYKDQEWIKQFIEEHFGVKDVVIEIKDDPYDETPFKVGRKDFGLSITGDAQEVIYEPHFDDIGAGGRPLNIKKTVLELLKEHRLLPENSQIKEVDSEDYENDGKVDNVDVIFLIKDINDMKVYGEESIISFDIRGDRVVIDMRWLEIKPFKEFPIKDPQEAFDDWRKGDGVVYDDESGKVGGIELVYYWDHFEGFIQPCYRFDCISDDGQRKFYGLIPAIKNEFLIREEAD